MDGVDVLARQCPESKRLGLSLCLAEKNASIFPLCPDFFRGKCDARADSLVSFRETRGIPSASPSAFLERRGGKFSDFPAASVWARTAISLFAARKNFASCPDSFRGLLANLGMDGSHRHGNFPARRDSMEGCWRSAPSGAGLGAFLGRYAAGASLARRLGRFPLFREERYSHRAAYLGHRRRVVGIRAAA